MHVIHLTATPGPDGLLHLSVPVGSAAGEYEVEVVVRPKAASPPTAPTPEDRGWPPGFLESTYGSIQDEAFVAPPRPVPPLDAG